MAFNPESQSHSFTVVRDGNITDVQISGPDFIFTVVTVPSGITQVEKRAVRQSARQAGAREAFLIEEPIAAALGAGLPVVVPCDGPG